VVTQRREPTVTAVTATSVTARHWHSGRRGRERGVQPTAGRLTCSPTPGCGAGENRTPVHQALNARATTIPDFLPDAGSPAGRLAVALERRPANRLSESSSVFPDASCLSRCHPPLLLPGCGGSAPCAISGHDVSSLTW